MHTRVKIGIVVLTVLLVGCLAVALFTIFFDQAVIVRKGTIYQGEGARKVVALTFDDGPSPEWTPKILAELRRAGVKATFFMLGEHVRRYPDVARLVAQEGHEIENHSYGHDVLLYFSPTELESSIKRTELTIRDVTGKTTRYFRPPKAWLTNKEKQHIKNMGYGVVLWSLNSKDWVTFDDMYIRKYILRNIRPGDIILFHDSGGAFAAEGGDRHETVNTIYRLVEQLRERGYECVTVDELIKGGTADAAQ